MKRLIKAIITLAALVFILCGFSACSSDTDLPTPDAGFYIKDMIVFMDASAGDRSMIVSEQFIFRFTESDRHGVYRDIPLNSGEKVRGIKVSAFSAVDDSFSTEKYEVSHYNDDILRIKIGDSEKFLPRDKDIAVTVSYMLITPMLKNSPDSLMLNVVGQGWTCKIEKATIKVTLPVEAKSFGAVRGTLEQTNTIKVDQSGNEYNIVTDGQLKPFEGITASFDLPENSLTAYKDNHIFITLAACLALLFVLVILKLTLARNTQIVAVRSFYPPKRGGRELTPLENGYLIDSKCSASDVTSLIFYWASKGYLQISEEGGLTLTKVCDLPSDKQYEKGIFDRLFMSGDIVKVESLKYALNAFVPKAAASVKAEYKNKLYSPKVKVLRVICLLAVVLFSVINIMVAYFRISSKYFNVFWFIFIPITIAEFYGAYIADNWLKLDKKRNAHLINFVLLCVIGTMLFIFAIHADAMRLAETLILLSTISVTVIITPFISKRTDYYNELLCDVVGFRDFIKSADKQKLEQLLQENPQYFYEILPYANVLGASTIWQDKFKDLTLSPPSYFCGDTTMFNLIMFNTFYRNAYTSFANTTNASPVSTTSSGGGGGNYSGGGFGGGGGGSW